MIIKNATLRTEYDYQYEEWDEYGNQIDSQRVDVLAVEINIPGGVVLFKLKISQEQAKAIESAEKLGASIETK